METLEQRVANLSPAKRELLQRKLDAMKKNDKEKSKQLLTLQEGDVSKRRPVFFMHPPLGVTGYFLNIVRHLHPEQPAYGIQCPALLDAGEAFDNYEEMAASYLEAVRSVQPDPPYMLVGHSSGAYTIYEMALQLGNHKDQLPCLVFIDSEAPTGDTDPVMDAYKTPDLMENDQTMFLAAWLVSLAHNQELSFTLEDVQACTTIEDKYSLVAGFLKRCGFISQNTGNDMVKVVLKMIANHSIADTKYFEKHTPDDPAVKYEGRVVLFRCMEETKWPGFDFTSPADTSEYSGWEKFCSGSIDVIGIPEADHLTIMMEPCVRAVAEYLQTCLDQVTPR